MLSLPPHNPLPAWVGLGDQCARTAFDGVTHGYQDWKDNLPASEKRLITVIGDSGGIRTIELTSVTEVRLLLDVPDAELP